LLKVNTCLAAANSLSKSKKKIIEPIHLLEMQKQFSIIKLHRRLIKGKLVLG